MINWIIRRYSRRWRPGGSGLGVPAGKQPRHRASRWNRRPTRDGPGAYARLHVVGDPWEPPTQLDRSRQLSLLIEDGADRSSISLGNDEHRLSMAMHAAAGKPGCVVLLYVSEDIIIYRSATS
jgi:hypothetical protein